MQVSLIHVSSSLQVNTMLKQLIAAKVEIFTIDWIVSHFICYRAQILSPKPIFYLLSSTSMQGGMHLTLQTSDEEVSVSDEDDDVLDEEDDL